MPSRRPTPPRADLLFLAGGLLAVGGFLLLPHGGLAQGVLYVAVDLAAVAAVAAGVRRHRPARPVVWWVLAAGLLVDAVANAGWFPLRVVLGRPLSFPSSDDGLIVAAYGLLLVALVLLARARQPDRDWQTVLDVLIVTLGAGVLFWVFRIDAEVESTTLSLTAKVAAVAYPLLDVLLVGALVRLIATPGRRPAAFWLLVGGIAAQLGADVLYAQAVLRGSFRLGGPLLAGWLASWILLGAAALHPSMAALTQPGERRPEEAAWRLALLGLASLITPAVLVVQAAEQRLSDVPLLAVVAAVMFLLVLARLRALTVSVAEHARTEAALRQQAERLQRQAELLDLAHDAVIVRDLDGVISFWSRGAEAMYGWTAEEACGQVIHDLLHTEFATVSLADLQAALLRDGHWEGEVVHQRKDGAHLTVASRLALQRDDQGEPGAVLALYGDVTERRRAQQELDRFFSVSLDLLCIADTDGYFTRLNPAWEQVLGYSLEELMSRPYTDFVHPDDVEPTRREASAQVGGADVVAFENRYRCKDGSYRWLRWTSRPDLDTGLLYAAARDVTEQKAATEALTRTNRRLQELDRQKSDFVSSVSHEFRTPLSSIVGYAEMLLDQDAGELAAEQRHMVEVIDRNTRRLLDLIDDLLTMSRIESGRLQLRIERLEVAALLEGVGEAVLPDAASRGIRLEVAADGDVGAVHADAGQLERVLLNLLSNALKFSPEGGRVRLRAARQGDTVVLSVSDQGIGIPVEEQGKLFTRFFRSSTATEQAIQGTGLGLAIARSIVEQHGGSIALESAPGEGTTVTIALAAAPAAVGGGRVR